MGAFVDAIKAKYPKIKEAIHIGNEYGKDIGDVKLIMEDHSVRYLELKASESASGHGTLANISQNSITEYGLLFDREGNKIKNWQDFRDQNGFKLQVEKILDEYDYGHKLNFEKKARYIKNKAESGDDKAAQIKKRIILIANNDKKEYIRYLRYFSSNEDNIIKFVFCLINGLHNMRLIKKLITTETITQIRDRYDELITFYANIVGVKIEVTEQKSKMKELLRDYHNFRIKFPDPGEIRNTCHIVCNHKTSKKEICLINFVFNWKNIFQGIKTPCLNVFLGPFLLD